MLSLLVAFSRALRRSDISMMKFLIPIFFFFSLGKRRMQLGDFLYLSIDIPSAKIAKKGSFVHNVIILSRTACTNICLVDDPVTNCDVATYSILCVE